MGTLSLLLEFTPFSGPLRNDLNNPQTVEIFKPAVSYPEPEHFTFFPKPGPFTVAGISEVFGLEFLASKQKPVIANTQIVSVPERPVDKGTFDALIAGNNAKQVNYNGPQSGVYLQNRSVGTSKVTIGQAPTQGIYSGLQNIGTGDDCQ